jgi:alkylation response protein AidB-like acyl-CoA dehydrogenase
MNFDVGEQEKKSCRRIRELFAEHNAAELSKMETLHSEDLQKLSRRWFTLLESAGYLTCSAEEGRNTVSLAVIQEQLAALSPALFLSVEVSVRIFGRLLARFGTEEQKIAILPDLMSGTSIGAVALSEEGMNTERSALNTKGVPTTRGFSVTGSKGHVINAPIADWIAVAGKIDGCEGPAFFLIKKGRKGLFVGDRLITLGYEGVPISPIGLDDCPASHVIHPPVDQGILKTVRMWEDQILTAAGLGLMKQSFDAALQYAKTHQSGGKSIIAHQEVGFKLAEMLTLFQTAQLLAYRAAWMSEVKDREAEVLAHSAKVFCGEAAERITSDALQILGGEGYIRGNPVETGYRDAKYIQIAGTSTEISRMKIGDWVLKYL